MPRKAKELKPIEVKRMTQPGLHAVGGVAGLLMQVTPTGARSWILRTMIGAKRRDIGLGGFPDVTLAQARDRARETKDQIKAGMDPVEQRKAARLARIADQAKAVTFEQAALDCHNVKRQEFRNSKHAEQWLSTLKKYAFPLIGKQRVDAIESSQVLATLRAVWTEKPETASRVRQRIATVFDYALAAGIRTAPNPAAWKGCLEPLLPKTEKIRMKAGGRKHHPALPVEEVPRLIDALKAKDSIPAKALIFTILTAARSLEIRGATWHEVDMKKQTWTVPAERMKGGKLHVVPLSAVAVKLLELLPSREGLLFPNLNGDKLSDMTLSKLLKDMHAADTNRGGKGYMDPIQDRVATPHGTARSSFKEWTRQGNRFPDEWSELALAHVNNDATRAAYARDHLLDERRGMMEQWGQYCLAEAGAESVHIAKMYAR